MHCWWWCSRGGRLPLPPRASPPQPSAIKSEPYLKFEHNLFHNTDVEFWYVQIFWPNLLGFPEAREILEIEKETESGHEKFYFLLWTMAVCFFSSFFVSAVKIHFSHSNLTNFSCTSLIWPCGERSESILLWFRQRRKITWRTAYWSPIKGQWRQG